MERVSGPPGNNLHHKNGRQFRPYNVLMVIVMGLGSISYGYTAGIISTTLAQPSFIHYFGLETRSNASDLIGLMSSLFQAGGFFGTFAVSVFSDRWGRKVGIAIPAALILISNALCAGSVQVGMFITFRFFAGAGAYMMVSAVPIWTTEVAPPNVRGVLVNIHGCAIILGFAASNWVGYGFWHLDQWRAPLAFGCLAPLGLLAGLYWMPESPRWLLMNDRAEEADRILRKLHQEAEAKVEFVQIQRQVEIDHQLDSSYWSMITKASYRKRAIMGVFTTVAIQLTGPFVINNYGPVIYSHLGFDTNKQLVYQVGWITLGWGGAIFSLAAIDWVTRPVILGGGILCCIACLIVEAALVANYATAAESLANPNATALKAAVAMVYVYIFIFETTLDGSQFVYLGEIFPTHLRAKGISLGMAGLCLINVVWLQVAPIAFTTIGWRFYLCFIVPGALAGAFILLVFPDTRGLPLENIAQIFGDKAELFSYEELEKDSQPGPQKTDFVVHMEAV